MLWVLVQLTCSLEPYLRVMRLHTGIGNLHTSLAQH